MSFMVCGSTLYSHDGQTKEIHSISAGPGCPGSRPEHSWLKDGGRAEYVVSNDEVVLRGYFASVHSSRASSRSDSRANVMTDELVLCTAPESSRALWEGIR